MLEAALVQGFLVEDDGLAAGHITGYSSGRVSPREAA